MTQLKKKKCLSIYVLDIYNKSVDYSKYVFSTKL